MCSSGTQGCFDGSELYCGLTVTETTTSVTSSIEGVIETEDPNVTRTYVKDTEVSGDVMFVSTMTTTTTVNSDGTETVVVTEALEVFRDGELSQSLESVVSEETRPTTTEFIQVEAQPISVGLTEEQARAEADAAEGTTVTEITTTTTTTEGEAGPTVVGLTEEQALAEADEAEATVVGLTEEQALAEADEAEATVVGLTEEQALAEADEAEGTTVTEITTTVTETTGDDEPTVVGLTEEQALAEADAAEGTTVTEITTTTTTTTEGEGQPESVGLTEE